MGIFSSLNEELLHLAAIELSCMLRCHCFRNAASKGTEGSTLAASSGLRLSLLSMPTLS